MALTLTQTAQMTKRAFVAFVVFIFLITVGFISYQIYYYQYYLPHKPKPVIKPQVLWGKLPYPSFPQSASSSANLTYTLATTSGGLPTNIPNMVKVYFVAQLGTTLTAPDNAKTLAGSLSFPNGPIVENQAQTQYQFTNDQGNTLTIDLVSGNFSFEREASTSGVLQDDILPDETTLVSNFKDFLNTKNLLKDDLKDGRSKVTYDQNSQQGSTTATVTIWPADLGGYQIVTPTFTSGLISARVGKAKDEVNRYLSLHYTYWSIDPSTTSTYPLITPQQALDKLNNNEATVISAPLSSNVPITSVTLAYFESDQSTPYIPYIEPIYVFQGDNFVAYVPAIDPQFLTSPQ